MITGTGFVDLSAAYDPVNHRLLIQKLFTRQLNMQSYSEPAVKHKIMCGAEQRTKRMEATE